MSRFRNLIVGLGSAFHLAAHYEASPEVRKAFEEIWQHIRYNGEIKADSTGDYFRSAKLSGVEIIRTKAGRAHNFEYEDKLARQKGGMCYEKEADAIILEAPGLRVLAIYNSHCHVPYVRFDRGSSRKLLEIHEKLIAPKSVLRQLKDDIKL